MSTLTHPAINQKKDLAVVIGRWQMLSKDGHQRLFEKAFEVGQKVLIVIGSAFRSRNPRNPFTWEERKAMILATLSPSEQARVSFLPVRDYYDNARWTDAVATGVAGHVPHGASITLVGWKKDHTSDYLDYFPGWTTTTVAPTVAVDATSLRSVFFGSQNITAALEVLKAYVSKPVLDYLEAWSHLPVFQERKAEHQAVVAYKEEWGEGPFLTADAIIEVSGRILLVRRNGTIGHGLWALPGGHMEPGEQFYTAAVRELHEETGFAKMPETMQAALKSSVIFDHPLRSPRARVISMACYFDFEDMPIPDDLKVTDEIIELGWFNKDEIEVLAMTGQLFEDHDVILDRRLKFY